MAFKPDYRLMKVKRIAELSYHFPLRPLSCIQLSGRLRQVLLLIYAVNPCDLVYLFITNRNPFLPSQTEKEQ